jgi:hypothetical protein
VLLGWEMPAIPSCVGWLTPNMLRLVIARDSRSNSLRLAPEIVEAPYGCYAWTAARPPGWVWVYCARYVPPCQHHAPMALAPLIIRWSPDASSDVLRQCARCTVCGHKGATLQHPGWIENGIGWQPFPVENSEAVGKGG